MSAMPPLHPLHPLPCIAACCFSVACHQTCALCARVACCHMLCDILMLIRGMRGSRSEGSRGGTHRWQESATRWQCVHSFDAQQRGRWQLGCGAAVTFVSRRFTVCKACNSFSP